MRLSLFSIATLPLRLAMTSLGTAVRVGSSVAERLVRVAVPGADASTFVDEPEAPRPPVRPHRTGPARPPRRQQTPPAPPSTPATPAATRDLQPDPPVSEEPVLVADSADPGAEDGAGPEIEIGEPWPGYRKATAAALVERIEQASAAEVAVVEFYERAHRRRKSVLEAAERRLRLLSDPARR